MKLKSILLGILATLSCSATLADINVGVTLSATGPAASLGMPEKNTFALLPTRIGTEKVNFIVLDDATDPSTAVKNTHKLINEDKVDVIIGSTVTPNSLAMVDVVAEAETPMIAMAAGAKIVSPMDEKRRWVFKTPQNDSHMATAIIAHMVANGVKTIGFISFNDAYGEGWWSAVQPLAEKNGLRVVANERYSRNDTSVTGQVLKIMAANPDAAMIAGSGTPAALPQKTLVEKGFKGKIYQTHGVANQDFLRVGGKDVEGTLLPAGPILVASQLPDSNPIKPIAMDFVTKYQAAYGAGNVSTFAGHAWDANLMLHRAIPVAMEKAKPGTKEFRAALRDALEGIKDLVAVHGVFTMSPTDHLGLDERSRVMVKIVDGAWVLQK